MAARSILDVLTLVNERNWLKPQNRMRVRLWILPSIIILMTNLSIEESPCLSRPIAIPRRENARKIEPIEALGKGVNREVGDKTYIALTQRSELLGDYLLCLNDDSFLLRIKDTGVSLSYKEGWRAVKIFNEHSRKVSSLEIGKTGHVSNPFTKASMLLTGLSFSGVEYGPETKLPDAEEASKRKKLNLPNYFHLVCFDTTKAFQLAQNERKKRHEIYSSSPISARVVVLTNCFKSSVKNERALELLGQVQDIDTTFIEDNKRHRKGVPLQIDYQNVGGDKRNYLSTYRVSIQKGTFEIEPAKDFTVAKNANEVIQNSGSGDAIELMILDH
ncbi:MAG: hypothetical protein K2Y32_14490 [Candidatus Obscuribacterales bacterium]|nr:hypothetical protein [Candidatus Obscuribacterales bacterium]